MGGKIVKMFSNSRLVIGQVKGELEVRDERMQGYLRKLGICNQDLNHSAYYMSLKVETHMLIP